MLTVIRKALCSLFCSLFSQSLSSTCSLTSLITFCSVLSIPPPLSLFPSRSTPPLSVSLPLTLASRESSVVAGHHWEEVFWTSLMNGIKSPQQVKHLYPFHYLHIFSSSPPPFSVGLYIWLLPPFALCCRYPLVFRN